MDEKDLTPHFAGPAFLPWQRMGNMEAFGGPLSPSWHNFTVGLQHQILQRMRNYGMTPVVPAFAGHIPKALVEKYPQIKYYNQTWNHFEATYLLDANEPIFQDIGATFIQGPILDLKSLCPSFLVQAILGQVNWVS